MKNQGLGLGVIIIIIVIGAFLVSNNANTPPTTTATPTATSSKVDNAPANTVSDKLTVTATDTGFSPSQLTIKSGETVVFLNQSSSAVWPASDPHPIHTGLPGFDAKHGLAHGESYEFTFVKTGSFGYHNHLNPSTRGTIVVE